MPEMRETVVNCTINPDHIDAYGHLNNSKYGEYFELGRKALQKKYGIEGASLREDGIGLLMRESNEKYLSLVIAEHPQVEIRSHFRPYSPNNGARIYMEHQMINEGNIMATAVQEYFFARLGGVKPKPIRPLEKLVLQLS